MSIKIVPGYEAFPLEDNVPLPPRGWSRKIEQASKRSGGKVVAFSHKSPGALTTTGSKPAA
jgi:hypothetical protein